MLNWGLCRGHAVIPKALGLEMQKENMDIFSFKLSAEEMEAIKSIDIGRRFCDKFVFNHDLAFFA